MNDSEKHGVPWLAISAGIIVALAIGIICFIVWTFAAQERNGGPFVPIEVESTE